MADGIHCHEKKDWACPLNAAHQARELLVPLDGTEDQLCYLYTQGRPSTTELMEVSMIATGFKTICN